MMQVTPVKNQSQVNPSLTLLPPDVTSLILGDSWTFCQIGRANVWQKMIFRERSLKHLPGQSLNTLCFSQFERKLTLV
jgi:hypothetical protein